jgi:Tol biopolymer transport system component
MVITSCVGNPLDGTGVDCDPMAYQLDNQVWVLSAGESLLLSEPGMVGANPSVSPDGKQVAFASGEHETSLDLFVVASDGAGRRMIWNGQLVQSSVDWSPDGSVLVFDQYSERDGMIDVPLQIFTIPSGGSREPAQLTEGAPNGKPKWGSDGRVLFLSLRDGVEQEIYSMNPDGSDQVNLTNHPSSDVLAEMSPDGSSIVFASDRAGDGDLDIWTMDSNGLSVRRLTDGVERDTNPTWTSNGEQIIYRSDKAPAGLWLMNSDGSNQVPMLSHAWVASCP